MMKRKSRDRRKDAATLCAGGLTFAVALTGMVALGIQDASAPQPADQKAPLANSTGATAAVVGTPAEPANKVLVWPATWQPGTVPAGTPCSNYGVPPGSRTTKVIEALGPLRRCR